MLKITQVASSNREIILQLDGRLTGQWIQLLRDTAQSLLQEATQLTLDLENLCFIDCEGVVLIKSLMNRGVRQINAPLFVAEQIRNCKDGSAD